MTGILANGAYLVALMHFDPASVANIVLLEPFVGQVIGCLLGQDQIPGILTIGGGLIALTGYIVTGRGGKRRKAEMEKKAKERERK